MNGPDKELVVSYLTLRKMIGWLGLALPTAVRVLGYVTEHIHSTGSISAYYYTGMRDLFVSTLVLVGMLLTVYRTPDKLDNVIAVAAGIAAIGIGLFPMDPTIAPEILHKYPGALDPKCYIMKGALGFHMLFTVAFFALAFVMVFFRFEKVFPGQKIHNKGKRIVVYKICGGVMFAAFAVIGVMHLLQEAPRIFVPESVAVMAFAVAWLVKGQLVLKG
jgi:hypothetical protein